MTITARTGDALTAREVYEIWRIRDVVFAVEQRCDEPDVDDVDLRADCTHLWIPSGRIPSDEIPGDKIPGDEGRIASYLRTVVDGGVRKVGRVATVRDARGAGLSSRLLRDVVRRWGDEELVLGAQIRLEPWYGSFGFAVCGPRFVEAGLDHVPMRRPPGTDRATEEPQPLPRIT